MSDITELSLGEVRTEYVQYLKSHEYAETTARILFSLIVG